MDAQVQALFEAQEAQLSGLTQRIAALEQTVERMRDMMQRMADHAGFSHPGFGDER